MSARLEVLVDGSWRPLRVVGATVVLTVTAVIVLGLALFGGIVLALWLAQTFGAVL
jgi:predicted phosphoribosyltransferase